MVVYWLVATTIIRLMMEAARTSEMPVNTYKTTLFNISENSHLQTHYLENLES